MEELYAFFSCYRMLINTYRLAPEVEAAQLLEILRRVRDVHGAAPPPVGRSAAALVQAGGSNP